MSLQSWMQKPLSEKTEICFRKASIFLEIQKSGFPINRFKKLTGRGNIEKYLYLYSIAKSSSGAIIEIGSYLGLGSFCLAEGSFANQKQQVYCVDPQQKSLVTKTNIHYGNTRRCFLENVALSKGKDLIFPIYKTSKEAVKDWSGEIGLLFIDGDHAYNALKQDWELWSKFVSYKGLILIDDIGKFDGVTKFYKELLKNEQEFIFINLKANVAVFKRVSVPKAVE